MPGTPIIYYGDEIGMGNNIELGDRNGECARHAVERPSNAGSPVPRAGTVLPLMTTRLRIPHRERRSPATSAQLLAEDTRRLIAARKKLRAFDGDPWSPRPAE